MRYILIKDNDIVHPKSETFGVRCKPNGTTAKMIGKRSGAGYSGFRWMIRRIRVQQYSPMYYLLDQANVPHEPDFYSANTEVFEYPLAYDDGTKTAEEVTLWEQAMNIVLLQREWSDNAVSNTLMFKPKWILKRDIYGRDQCENYISTLADMIPEIKFVKNIYEDKFMKIVITNDNIKEYRYNPFHEENDIESVLSAIVPLIKTCSLMPHTAKGVYKQIPEEGITKEEYERRKAVIKPIDWSKYNIISENVEQDKYCSTDKCEIQPQ